MARRWSRRKKLLAAAAVAGGIGAAYAGHKYLKSGAGRTMMSNARSAYNIAGGKGVKGARRAGLGAAYRTIKGQAREGLGALRSRVAGSRFAAAAGTRLGGLRTKIRSGLNSLRHRMGKRRGSTLAVRGAIPMGGR